MNNTKHQNYRYRISTLLILLTIALISVQCHRVNAPANTSDQTKSPTTTESMEISDNQSQYENGTEDWSSTSSADTILDRAFSNGLRFVLSQVEPGIQSIRVALGDRHEDLIEMGRLSLGLEESYFFDEDELSENLLTDINNNGQEDLIVRWYTGGAHCCFGMKVYEVNKKGQLEVIFDGPEKDRGGYEFVDVDGDGSMEVVTYDDALAYFDCSYNCSSSIRVIQQWSKNKYRPVLLKQKWNEAYSSSQRINQDSFIASLPLAASNIKKLDFWSKKTGNGSSKLVPPEFWNTEARLKGRRQ